MHVNVWPAVSADTVAPAQSADVEVTSDSGSETVNDTTAFDLCHPLLPSVPVTLAVTTGGDGS